MSAFYVAAFIKDLQAEVSPPTVKQHMAAIRMLFDWLVTGHIIDVNPAHAVRGPNTSPSTPAVILFRTTAPKSGALTEKPNAPAGCLSHDPEAGEGRRRECLRAVTL